MPAAFIVDPRDGARETARELRKTHIISSLHIEQIKERKKVYKEV
jgi:hypothetical protein